MKRICVLFFIFIAGCSTFKGRALTYMGSAFVLGGVTGASSAPKNENENVHGLLWGSTAALIVGTGILLITDEKRDVKDRDYKIRELEMKLSEFQENSKTISQNGESSFFESKLPKEYSHLVKPGKWKLYKIDEWKKNNEGEFVHQDRLLEIEPAEINL